MKKATELRLCNWILLILTFTILASGIQLEINPEGSPLWAWLHIALGLSFIAIIVWHILIHNWPRTAHSNGRRHPWLGGFFLLTTISGCLATAHWYGTFTHSTIGGIHGKLGFLFIITIAAHIRKHIRFYRRKKSGTKISDRLR